MEYRKIAQFHRDVAEICERLADLEEREKAGEDVQKEIATALGEYMIKYAEVNQ